MQRRGNVAKRPSDVRRGPTVARYIFEQLNACAFADSVSFATLPVRRELGGKFEIELVSTYDVVMFEQVDCLIVFITYCKMITKYKYATNSMKILGFKNYDFL